MKKEAVGSRELGTIKRYVIGFSLSLILTLTAYFLVVERVVNAKWVLAGLIGALAIGQFITQMTLFLRLGQEPKPKFKLLIFGFMMSVVIILVAGSIWIMYNLNYRMDITPQRISNYLKQQDGGF